MALIKQSSRSYYANENYGKHQFVSLDDIINQFMLVYVGHEKIINKASRVDVSFWAQRALAELSFDTLKSFKSWEELIPPSLQIPLPQDYVNYTKLSWVDQSGIKHPIYPTKHTSAPAASVIKDEDGDIVFKTNGAMLTKGEMLKNGGYQGLADHWEFLNPGPNAPAITLDINNDIQQGFGIVDNKLVCVDLPDFGRARQLNLEIKNNHKYKVTYTISNYTSGTVKARIVDNLGHATFGAGRTANGTYTETLTAGESTFAEGTLTKRSFRIGNYDTVALGNFTIDNVSLVEVGNEDESFITTKYKANSPVENQNDDYDDETYWPHEGERYGLNPEHAQVNGSFFIDEHRGIINFSSNISGKTVILDYISDSLGTPSEMKVHKFAEEAMYKWITYGVLSTKSNVPEYVVQRYKKEKFAATRQAKLRLSNIKLEEITQILRNKSTHIKH